MSNVRRFMRDPKRIPAVLDALRQAWERNPDLRLGQLLVIAAHPREPCPELFHIEDEALIHGLAAYRTLFGASRGELEEVEVLLGAEFDSALFQRLVKVVTAAGGQMSEASYAVGGSQEVKTYDVVLPSGKLVVTRETYVGLSLRGPAEIVQEVRRAVQSA
jgi:uncharacterized protein YihD (DUF1040 family)